MLLWQSKYSPFNYVFTQNYDCFHKDDNGCKMHNEKNACNTFIIHACWHYYKSNSSVYYEKILIEGIILGLIQGKG